MVTRNSFDERVYVHVPLLQIRQLQEKRSKASRKIILFAAEAKMAVMMTNEAVAAYVTFDDEMAAVEARVRDLQTFLTFFFTLIYPAMA